MCNMKLDFQLIALETPRWMLATHADELLDVAQLPPLKNHHREHRQAKGTAMTRARKHAHCRQEDPEQ
jgi:hypothetical protein